MMDSRPNRAAACAAVVLLAAFGAWTLVRALRTEGFLEADEVAHYLYARHAPAHPMNLLHPWARPLYTVLLVPFAQLGLGAARLFSVACALAAAFCAWRAGRAFGWRTAACAIPLAFAQPLFFQQTSGLWTEVAFAAAFGAWVLAVAKGNLVLVASIAAALPLIRPEGFVIAAATIAVPFAGALRGPGWKPVRLVPLLIVPSGVALWALLGFAASGEPLWLLRSWPPNWAPGFAYGQGSWTWIPDVLPKVVPAALIPLLVLGCFAPGMRRGWPIVLASALVLAVHAALWRFGAFGSAGYARYFVTLAPAFAVLTAGGVEVLARVARQVPAAAWPAAAAAFAAFLLLRHPTATTFPPLPPDARLFAALGQWMRTQDPRPELWSAHPFAYLELDSVPADRFADFGWIPRERLRAATVGAWVLVEDRFYPTLRGSDGNPDESELSDMGFARVEVPDLGIGLEVTDSRHDRALEHMKWALFRKRRA